MSPSFDSLRSASIGADVYAASMASREALLRRQRERLEHTLRHAIAESAFYRARLTPSARAEPTLADFPVVTKNELMAGFGDWVTDPAISLESAIAFMADPARIGQDYLDRYTIWQTSGSSGEPGVFIEDAQAMAVNDALESLRRPAVQPLRRLFDPWYLSERTAFVGATTGHFASTVSIERLRRLNPGVRMSTRSFSFLAPVVDLVKALNAFRPTVLATYPTAAVLLAEEAAAGRLSVDLREVWTGGELLSEGMRSAIESRFGCPVVNQYGASEFLALASACGCKRLHLNCDWAVLENVDDKGCPVAEGTTGATVLLTNLANRVQPLIRYGLGDRVSFRAQRCECGSSLPVIEVEGRTEEALVLRARDGRAVHLLPLALATVLEDDAAVFDFQLCRKGAHALQLRLGASLPDRDEAADRARTALGRWLGEQGLGDVEIEYRSDQVPVMGRSGKVPRVVADAPNRVGESPT